MLTAVPGLQAGALLPDRKGGHSLFRTGTLVCCLLLALAGCRAQTAVNSPGADNQLERRVEVQVRSQFNIPPNVDVKLGTRSKSDVPGFDNLPVTLSQGSHTSTVSFLISADGKTLARFEKFDISKDPSDIVSAANRPERGAADAKVTIVNFDDLECPYCAQMHHELFPATLDHYKGLVKIVYKDYPLVELHPWALHAAIDANCLAAQSQQAYWTYVDYLHTHGQDVTGPDRDVAKSSATLDKLARDEGQRDKLDSTKLDACLNKQDASTVQTYMKEGDKLGVTGTPTLFVNGERMEGWKPQEQLWEAIDRALKAEGVQPPPPEKPAPAQGTQPGPEDQKQTSPTGSK
jgi:protein-disulfide isomerase